MFRVLAGSIVLVAALGLAASATAAPRGCAASPADRAAVAQTVRAFYDALAHDDLTAVARLTARDFYAFDAGQRFTAASLGDTIAQAHKKGVVLRWNLGEIDAHVTCETAWAAWTNTGQVGSATALTPMTWQESATLQREGGRWIIAFLHSNRLEAPK